MTRGKRDSGRREGDRREIAEFIETVHNELPACALCPQVFAPGMQAVLVGAPLFKRYASSEGLGMRAVPEDDEAVALCRRCGDRMRTWELLQRVH